MEMGAGEKTTIGRQAEDKRERGWLRMQHNWPDGWITTVTPGEAWSVDMSS